MKHKVLSSGNAREKIQLQKYHVNTPQCDSFIEDAIIFFFGCSLPIFQVTLSFQEYGMAFMSSILSSIS